MKNLSSFFFGFKIVTCPKPTLLKPNTTMVEIVNKRSLINFTSISMFNDTIQVKLFNKTRNVLCKLTSKSTFEIINDVEAQT